MTATLLFIHGFLDDATVWDDVIAPKVCVGVSAARLADAVCALAQAVLKRGPL